METTHNQPEFTVSSLSDAIRSTVEGAFGWVRVRGEISGFKKHSSGHCYLSLKDDASVLGAVCWKGVYTRLGVALEDGLEIIASGKITTYGGQSKYQLVIERVELAGVGALMALLEKRRLQLAAEGLFDAVRKKPLPLLPKVIGIITSPTGAVIRDILHRLRERCGAQVLIWPVAVQGQGAAEQVAAAIAGFNAPSFPQARPDVLIVARGGGSLEDLWAFNEEIVVRAAATSTIPLISAVGHETDTTLIDFAADRRAPTPTAAAEMAVPVKADWLAAIAEYQARLAQAVLRQAEHKAQMLAATARGLRSPLQLWQNAQQRLDDWSERLRAAPAALLERKTQQLARYVLPQALLKQRWQMAQQKVENMSALLESFHYKKVLQRGFAIARTADGSVLPSAAAARAQSPTHLEFADGVVSVSGGDVPTEKPTRPKRSKLLATAQDDLFG